jgi:hypothetical protein
VLKRGNFQNIFKHLQKIQIWEFQKKSTPSKLEILILYIERVAMGMAGVPPSRR